MSDRVRAPVGATRLRGRLTPGRTALLLGALALVGALAAACTGDAGPGHWPSNEPYEATTVVLPAPGSAKIDLLFMLDNSNSFEPARVSLRQYFPNLEHALRHHDLHVGIITSDLGAGGFTPPSCDAIGGDQGRLQSSPLGEECATAHLLDDRARFLASAPAVDGGAATANFTGTLSEAFACYSRVGEGGCGFEHQLAAVRAALAGCDTPGGCAQPDNEGFLRADATLAVVILTDEDDCSAPPDSTLFDPAQHALDAELGPLTSYRCFEFGNRCSGLDPGRGPGPRLDCVPGDTDPDPRHQLIPVEEIATFLQALKPAPASLYVAVIAGPPGAIKVGLDANGYPDLQPACVGGLGTADPAPRLAQLVTVLSPARARFFPVCQQNLKDIVAAIGADLDASSVCLTGRPRGAALGMAAAPFECVVEDRLPVDGAPGTFQRQPVPPCHGPGSCPVPEVDCPCPFAIPAGATACWFVREDPTCDRGTVRTPSLWSSSGSGFRLFVERGTDASCSTTPAPPGTVTVVQCGTCAASPADKVFDCSPGCREYWPRCCPTPTSGCWG